MPELLRRMTEWMKEDFVVPQWSMLCLIIAFYATLALVIVLIRDIKREED